MRLSRISRTPPSYLPVMVLGVCLTGLLLGGCNSWPDGDDRIVNVVSLHLFEMPGTDGSRLFRTMEAPAGRPVHVRTLPLLSSRNFIRVVVTTAPDGQPALLATLDDHGRMLLMQLCAEHAGDNVAVAVDGLYRFAMRVPRQPVNDRTLLIPGPWNPADAQAVTNACEENYEKLNH
ncbi:MAG: hypothetical protein A3K19_01520 [Lentisphaerae bacterium RIFOXYB12_FULL_65_16]|nr:MAG: hypothetical protein A3K18_22875 [Lentisphaerae bacterium RIFOXYA12_64_32]OGV92819.1 MAG: hypothetical protein A3K19_01520 [Lentisphaerae bacterium RIFOXYB12_FULL_65_16]